MNKANSIIPPLGESEGYSLKILFISVSLQLLLGLFLGHLFEMRFYMATGYLVGTGQNPYVPQDLTAVFDNPLFAGITSFGYPPPWAMMLGLIYRITTYFTANFLLYNLAIKIPIIASNVLLAFVVVRILNKAGANAALSRKAWIFMLLNPFVLYASTAWGQIDSMVALFALLALVCLGSGKIRTAALLLAAAVSIKPIALPLVPVALVYLWGRSKLQAFLYFGIFCFSAAIFCAVPFVVFGWDPGIIIKNWNAHFIVGGCMSYLSFFELIRPGFLLPGQWWYLGFLWVPALGILTLVKRNGIADFHDLLRNGLAFVLVFFLTRTWMSEPNLLLILPFILILTSIGKLDPSILTWAWVLPLLFGLFNMSAVLLLFPGMPETMDKLCKLGEQFRIERLALRSVIVIPWLVIGWRTVFICLKKPSAAMSRPG